MEEYRNFQIKKAVLWQEIKSMEQEYKRNITQQEEIAKRQSDISFEVQKKIDKLQKITEQYDNYCYENKVGEFSPELKARNK